MFGAFAQFARDRHTEGAGDERPALWSPRDGKATADRARPIFHRMQPDPVAVAVIFGEANAIVPDAQPSPAAAAFKADIDLIGPAVADRVVHGFLRYPHKVRFRFVAQLGPAAVACKRAGDAVGVADIARQGLEGAAETGAVQADRAKTTGEVASLADGFVQEPDDLVGRGSRAKFSVRRQILGEHGSQRRDAGKGLTQSVMQFAADALLFAIGDLKDLPFQQFLLADVLARRETPRGRIGDHS